MEQTNELVVNAHRALIPLASKVSKGRQLQLRSLSNPEVQDCKIVYIRVRGASSL